MSTLATRFGRNQSAIRSDVPLSHDQMRAVAPSIFASDKHGSRSDRYTYIPTIDVLNVLEKEGFSPFMVCQSKTRDENNREHTKHMIRMRHASQIVAKEAQELILVNSHNGSSSYQLLSGVYRFVCSNGMVCGATQHDIRIKHSGDIIGDVIEGAVTVLESFDAVDDQMNGMKALTLNQGEQAAFAHAALALRYDTELAPAPITESQVLQPKRSADRADDLWTTFNRVQENMVRGGLRGRNAVGRPTTTRAVQGIDQSIKLNRALWVLAEEMRKLKG